MAALAVTVAMAAGCASVDDVGRDAAGEGGWLDDHDSWTAGDGALDATAGGFATTAGGAVEERLAGGAVEERLVGDEATIGAPPPDLVPPVEQDAVGLSAGMVDDNERWDDYLRYVERFEALGIPVRPYGIDGRRVVTVRDRSGRPVLDATVTVVAGEATVSTARTGADGRAVVFVPAAGDQQQGPAATVTVSKGDATAEVPADVLAPEVTLELDEATGRTALDLAFVIDATGSMGDEIERLKANMISVAERIAALPSAPDARFAMTVYRDRGDLFVTRTFDFTGDVATFTAALGEVVAADGGDTPEDVEAALADATQKPSWRGAGAVRLAFLVADAPPHLDYEGSVPYTASLDAARATGIRITPIASSGLDDQGEFVFRQLAQASMGRFVFLTYGADGMSPGTSTPHHVDDYSTLPLDDLVVQLVSDELAHRA
jgi:hypothetical protein